MIKYLRTLLPLFLIFAAGCSGKHLIKDKEYLDLISKSFDERKQLSSHRDKELYSVFNRDLSVQQSEALKFLYSFMPLSDLADYSGDFFLANADAALKTITVTPWGGTIPENIILHYVLPCRVNNENLDSFRIVYQNELLARVKGMDMTQAALEINHWCHEKVAYQGADSRTSAPMSTILSARGRCGEESTFTVSALRTAGIPARQVYTPRWAHTDDNHAWVEIWSAGEWHYMGACEPEPVTDRGWFTEPARRAMLVHTKSFGAPYGEENSINKFKNYTEVNNLSKYAVTKKIYVRIVDKSGAPVKDAVAEYQLYNYAEFYPLAVVPTDGNGISSFETGLGDLLVWARKNENFGFRKISVTETDTLNLSLDCKASGTYSINADLEVPVIRTPFPGIDVKLAEENTVRINNENAIRQKYIDSWIKPDEIKALALELKIDTAELKLVFSRSMGNYKEIRAFLAETPDTLRTLSLSMLRDLADKDLRDTKSSILADHLLNAAACKIKSVEKTNGLFEEYVLNPRVANEIIVPWRSYFKKNLPADLQKRAVSDPSVIIKYLEENISIADSENYYKTPLTPVGVHELRVSDVLSRSICFVAICRSLGIPSRLEPGSNVPQYFSVNSWNDVYFEGQNRPSSSKGFLRILSNDTKPVPEYYIHFTIARFENGRYNTLDYDYNKKITDFKDELALAPGHYMLVTGNRLNDSRILSQLSFFDLAENEHMTQVITLRKDNSAEMILGNLNMGDIVSLFKIQNLTSQECSKNGTVIVWIEPDKEPTKHIFNDLPLLNAELDAWGGKFLFLTGSSNDYSTFNPKSIDDLPANSVFSVDEGLKVLNETISNNKLNPGSLPYLIQCDNKGNILFTSSGYRIGIGEQIMKHAR
jgi:hypothetical protein